MGSDDERATYGFRILSAQSANCFLRNGGSVLLLELVRWTEIIGSPIANPIKTIEFLISEQVKDPAFLKNTKFLDCNIIHDISAWKLDFSTHNKFITVQIFEQAAI
jgi:hypothetical protein